MPNQLDDFLHMNDIAKEEFHDLIYQTLLLAIFEKIYNDLQKSVEKRHRLLDSLRNTEQEMTIVKKYCLEQYNVNLTDFGAELIYKWLLCYFRKDGTRKKYSDQFKVGLIKDQKNRCNICGKKIDLKNSQLDHIVPWTFVGDELVNNFHMLCSECNLTKNKSVTYLLKSITMKQKK